MCGSLYKALALLSTDELYVIVSIYWGDVNETDLARELAEGRRAPITRDWVHRRHLTAIAKMRRLLAVALDETDAA